MITYALDASALLCLVQNEPGAARVAAVLSESKMSSVNFSEAAANLLEKGADANTVIPLLLALGLDNAPFEQSDAVSAAKLRPLTVRNGLSFGDRACLALCLRETLTALIADRAGSVLGAAVNINVEQVRP